MVLVLRTGASDATDGGSGIFLDVVDDLDGPGLLEHQRALDLLAELEWLLEAEQQRCDSEPGLSSTVLPGLISMPFASGRVFVMPSTSTTSCTSIWPAAGEAPPIRRSAVFPLLVMVR